VTKTSNSDPDLPWRRTRKKTPEPHVGRIQKRMAKGESLEEAAEAIGIPFWLAKAVFVRSGLPVPRPIRRRGPYSAPPSDDVQVLLALKVMAVQLGAETGARGSVPLSMKEYDRRRDPAVHPSGYTVAYRFGSWKSACEQAGIPVRRRTAR
jgi:hypothetical protein